MAENAEAATVAVAAFGALDEGEAMGAFNGEVSRPAARFPWSFLSSQIRVWLRSPWRAGEQDRYQCLNLSMLIRQQEWVGWLEALDLEMDQTSAEDFAESVRGASGVQLVGGLIRILTLFKEHRSPHVSWHLSVAIRSTSDSLGIRAASRCRQLLDPPWRQPRGKPIVSLVNSHANATSQM